MSTDLKERVAQHDALKDELNALADKHAATLQQLEIQQKNVQILQGQLRSVIQMSEKQFTIIENLSYGVKEKAEARRQSGEDNKQSNPEKIHS